MSTSDTQRVVFTNDISQALAQMLPEGERVFVVTDSVVSRLYDPQALVGRDCEVFAVEGGEEAKTPATAAKIWEWLIANRATRHSHVVNLGGGMVTDLGGFAAATFKRGMPFINVPTTILGAVDAAVGGKTGVNFGGLKNEIGVFRKAEAVIVSSRFFNSLPLGQRLSGLAEMLKHGLLDSPALYARTLAMLEEIASDAVGSDRFLDLLAASVDVKRRIVAADPEEKGLRKALNLGHTVGHALEEFALTDRRKPVAHGYAVAWGLVVETVISAMKKGFPSDVLHRLATEVRDSYGRPDITCDDYPRLLELMSHDKKNRRAGEINFTLLEGIGSPLVDCPVDAPDIVAALDVARDIWG